MLQERLLPLAKRELPLVLLLAALAGALWAFAEIADEVVEGETRSFDESIMLALRNPQDLSDPIGPRWVEELGRDFTALGGVGVLVFLSLAVCGFLVIKHKHLSALLVLTAVAGGSVLTFALKAGFDRPRPELVPHGSIVYSASFPSGHSMMSAVVYLTLGALLARVQVERPLRVYVMALATVTTVAVGISRVYLGVHWPTDVLAGWTLGAAWAVLCWIVALWLQRRGVVEADGPHLSPFNRLSR